MAMQWMGDKSLETDLSPMFPEERGVFVLETMNGAIGTAQKIDAP